MTIVTTTTSSGPYTAAASTTFAVTFQSAGADEIEITLDGVVVSPSLYVFTRDPDGTGQVVFTTAISGQVIIYSAPTFAQATDYERFGAFFPDMINGPLDRAAAGALWLRERLAVLFPSNVRTVANRAGKFLTWDGSGAPMLASGTGADSAMRTDLAASGGSALAGVLQSGTGAVARTAQAKMRDALNIADFLPDGYVTDGSVDYTTQLQAAMTAAAAQKRALEWIGGTFKVTGTGLLVPTGLAMRGAGIGVTVVKNLSGNVLRLNGEFYDFSDMTLWSVAGGYTVLQTGAVAQSQFRRIALQQDANGFGVWSNATFAYIDNHFDNFNFQHTQSATVPSFNLLSAGGLINDNHWTKGRTLYSGEYAFKIDGSTANAQYSNHFNGITFEVCSGGGINLKGCKNFSITNCVNWDVNISTAAKVLKHFYLIETNGSGTTCTGRIANSSREAGVNDTGIYDVKLPAAGGGYGIIIDDCQSASGAAFSVDAVSNGIVVPSYIPSLMSIANAAFINATDPVAGSIRAAVKFEVAGVKVLDTRKTGWAVDTGTAKRTANATYAPGATLTYGAAYVQAEQTATATRLALIEAALRDATQTIKALKDDLHGTAGHGIIGT